MHTQERLLKKSQKNLKRGKKKNYIMPLKKDTKNQNTPNIQKGVRIFKIVIQIDTLGIKKKK